MASILLVHGAWHGGWCWRKVGDRLREAGHRVFAPSLTGLGDRAHLAHPDIDVDHHVRDVEALIAAEELDDLVLVGHSYAGMVISGLADRGAERLRALVYVDAFLPNDGESVMDLLAPERRGGFAALPPEVWLLPPVSAAAFGVRAPDDCAWIDRRCVGQPRKTFTQAVRSAQGWRRVRRRTYVLAGEYQRGPFQRYRALQDDPSWRFVELPCGHEIMIDLPDDLARIIDETANA